MRKRVLFVSTNTATVPYPVPPLGICLAAGAIQDTCETLVYDGLTDQGASLQRAVEDFRPDYVGLGIRNVDDMVMHGGRFFASEILHLFVEPLRKVFSGPLILGGAGFSIFPAAFMDLYDADYGVVGEAEFALPALVQALGKGIWRPSIPGVVGRDGVPAGPPSAPARLTDRAFSGIDQKLDFTPYRARGSYPIQTKRGCPFHCLYCTYPSIEGVQYRLREPTDIAEEIHQASERLGPVTFEFVDSVFNDPPGHADAVCRAIIRRGLKVRLRTMGVNPGGITGQLLRLMRDAGFAQIDCTPDSASPAMLARLRKNFGRPALEQAADLLRREQMPTMWFLIAGGPGETEATLRESFDFVQQHVDPRDVVHVTLGLRVYPGTGLHRTALQEGAARPEEDLFAPRHYVSPLIGEERLLALVKQEADRTPNLLPDYESAPPPQMMAEAERVRREKGLAEPMFRTLLRLRREGFLKKSAP